MIGINFVSRWKGCIILILNWEGYLRAKFRCYQWEGYMWSNAAFALALRKTMVHFDRVGRSQGLSDANWLLASSPALHARTLTLVPIWLLLHLKYIFTCVLWMSTKQLCITCAKLYMPINTYMHISLHTYIHICDYLSICKIWVTIVGEGKLNTLWGSLLIQ
jgi:hypothetical protein